MSFGMGVGIGTGMRLTSGAEPPVITGNSVTIPAGSVTWTLNLSSDYGYSADGQAFVVWQPGLTINSRTNAETTESALAVNGTMKNPTRQAAGGAQGWDARTPGYSAGLKQAFPISTAAGDIILGAVHQPGQAATPRRGLIASWSALHIVSSGWPAKRIAPSALGWSGRGVPTPYAVDLDAAVAALPSYDVTALSRPVLADIINRIDRLEIGAGFTDETAGPSYEYFYTYGAANLDNNYGRFLGQHIGAAMLYLISNVPNTAQKKTLLAALIRAGINTYDPIAGSGVGNSDAGGHWQFSHGPIVAALKYTGRTGLFSTLASTVGMNILNQAFVYDAGLVADMAPHSNSAKPFVSRLRNVSAASGTSVSIATNGATGDPSQINVIGMRLVQPSTGATGIIAAQDQIFVGSGTNTIVITLSATPSPVFDTSQVWIESPDPIRVGDADWRAAASVNYTNPAHQSTYRTPENRWTEEILFPHAINAYHPSFRAADLYITRANRASDPSAARDYPNNSDPVDGFNFAADFWTNHAASVFSQEPVFLSRPALSGTGAVDESITAVAGTTAGAATVSSTYQLYRNGTPIGWTSGQSYTVVSGDIGASFEVAQTATNGLGSQTVYSVPVLGIAGFTPNMVEFNGTTRINYNGAFDAGGTGSKTGLVFFDFYAPTTWPTGMVFMLKNAAGSDRFQFSMNSSGRFSLLTYDTTNTPCGNWNMTTNEFAVNTGYTVAISWNSATQVWQVYKRPWGGSWSAISLTGPLLVLNSEVGPIGRMHIASADGSTSILGNAYLGGLYIATDRYLDLSISGNRDKILPTVSKGTDGALVTGTAAPIFFDGITANWHQNKGTAGGSVLSGGTLTEAPVNQS